MYLMLKFGDRLSSPVDLIIVLNLLLYFCTSSANVSVSKGMFPQDIKGPPFSQSLTQMQNFC